MYSAIDVARYIIWYCKRRRYSISNLKLQKILYFVQANFLVSIGTPCFEEEIEAWDFGPVVPEVYHEFLPGLDLHSVILFTIWRHKLAG